MSGSLRVFIVAETAADLEALRSKARDAGWDVAGATLRVEWQRQGSSIPEAADTVLFDPRAVAALAQPESPVRERRDAITESLTVREREVLGLMADGLANREIATRLAISDHTVKFHLASIFGKFGVSSRVEAVRRGLDLGLIQI